jgi:hypothetical protein
LFRTELAGKPDRAIEPSQGWMSSVPKLAIFASLIRAGLLLAALGGCDDSESAQTVPLERQLTSHCTLGPQGAGYAFDDIRGVAVDSYGRIWVAEYDGLLHTFDKRGSFIRTIDRSGEGPGEFESIISFDIDYHTNRMAIVDNDNWGVLILSVDFTQHQRWRFPTKNFTARMIGVRLMPGTDGVLFPLAVRTDTLTKDGHQIRWATGVLAYAGEDGSVRDTLAPLVGRWSYAKLPPDGYTANAPSRGREIWIPLDTLGVLVGDGHQEYRLQLVGLDGRKIREYSRKLPREKFTEWKGPEMYRGFITRAVFDPKRGEILLCRVPPFAVEQTKAFDVDYFSVAGRYLGTLQWPACPVHADREGTIYALSADGDLAPYITAFRYAGEK